LACSVLGGAGGSTGAMPAGISGGSIRPRLGSPCANYFGNGRFVLNWPWRLTSMHGAWGSGCHSGLAGGDRVMRSPSGRQGSGSDSPATFMMPSYGFHLCHQVLAIGAPASASLVETRGPLGDTGCGACLYNVAAEAAVFIGDCIYTCEKSNRRHRWPFVPTRQTRPLRGSRRPCRDTSTGDLRDFDGHPQIVECPQGR